MTKYPFRICIIGPSGSGKGTQAELLASKLGVHTVSMGQLLRDVAAQGGKRGTTLESIMRTGEHVPNHITNNLIVEWIEKESKHKHGYIIEGYPRNREQYIFFEERYSFTHVVLITISDEEAVVRVSGRRVCPCGGKYHMKYNPPKHNETCDQCGEKLHIRYDNTPEATRERIKLYHKEMTSLINDYQKQGILYEVDGEQSIEKVHSDIAKLIV